MATQIVPDFIMPINRLGTDAEKYEACERLFGKKEIQPLWVADMDLPSPPFLQEALSSRIAHPCFGYTEQSNELKESICWWMREEHQLEIEQSDLLFSPSVVTSFNNAIAAYTLPADGVALFSPVYGPFFFAIKNHGRTLVDIPLMEAEGEYQIDFATFEQGCKEGKIKALLFCNPHNPSGRVWSKGELEKLVSLCRHHGVTLISDEIHSDIIFFEAVHTSVLAIDKAEECSVVLHSMGKTFNTSGLQGSFVIAPNRKLRMALHRVAELSHTSDCNLLAKVAMQTVFTPGGKLYKNSLINFLQTNRDVSLQRLTCLKTVHPMVPQSTFLLWIDFRNTGLSHGEIMAKLVDEAGVGLGGGLFFGPVGEGWFRLNFAVAPQELDKALSKIENIFR